MNNLVSNVHLVRVEIHSKVSLKCARSDGLRFRSNPTIANCMECVYGSLVYTLSANFFSIPARKKLASHPPPPSRLLEPDFDCQLRKLFVPKSHRQTHFGDFGSTCIRHGIVVPYVLDFELYI